jgi:cyclophilin family peptidyl-prolyl cis-trans isomerase/HEAT repeat protein
MLRPSMNSAHRAHSAVLSCLLASFFAASCEGLSGWKPQPNENAGRSQAVPTPSPAMPQNPLETIARFEDARADGDGLLQLMLLRGETPIRERAAMALGRLPFPEFRDEVTAALCAALDDPSSRVRAAAAFGLGMRADRDAAPALLAHWKESDATVRARIVEAASRIDDAKLRHEVVAALKDRSNEVRAEAALAPLRWQKQHSPPDAAAVDDALVELLRPRSADDGATASHATSVTSRAASSTSSAASDASPAVSDTDPATLGTGPATSDTARAASGASSAAVFDEDPEVVYRALFALARRKSERARASFHAALASIDVRQRTYAAQGLAALEPDSKGQSLLRDALGDRDWRVVCEAAQALGRTPDAKLVDALPRLLDHPSAHVRRCIYDLLGRITWDRDAAAKLLERSSIDPSSSVRAFAFAPRAKLLGDEFAPTLASHVDDEDPLLRAGVAAAFAHVSASIAVPQLVKLSADANLRVAGIAIDSLGTHATPAARDHLRTLLASPDNGLRLGALLALRESQVPEDLPFLEACYASSHGDIAPEIAYSAVESAAKLEAAGVLDFLKRAASNPSPYARKRARELLTERFPTEAVPHITPPIARAASVPTSDRDAFELLRNPRVEIKTSRGSMVFELFADETPVHVHSFLELVRAQRYDGTLFHRVVPDFVIQGGDPRGDGNGGASWRGDSLRHEFTPRKFVRGSLGMPRNDDPDSGGSQIFVTHRETPHLDGRYTLFGEMKSGFEVLDAIEVGDVIEGVRVLGPAGTR